MLNKWLIPALTALVLSAVLGLAPTAQAQIGYRGYIGPSSDVYYNAPYASIYRNVAPGLLNLGQEYLKGDKGRQIAASAGEYLANSPKGRRMVAGAVDYVDSPKGRRTVRQAKNYIQSPQGTHTLDAADVFLSTPNPVRDQVLSEISSGTNFDFLAGTAIGYLRTGQADLVGRNLTINQGGHLGAQVYNTRTFCDGRIEVDLPEGTTAVGKVEADGTGATMKFLSHGIAVPVLVTNYLPTIEKYPSR